eukprot:CAMPEP_0174867512 /NCGR_PEP_ID=MMETSP1114-20130205/64164_1 /TAXON_ID=312471 /ORGANISM="Neobodo designis, Strain CCAP 1951/1" /LENGTH=139 /DNA_ID=CAMNT_0016102709 /DNA_START=44 /DNA_END=459 /DNA_ORIENTATION=+
MAAYRSHVGALYEAVTANIADAQGHSAIDIGFLLRAEADDRGTVAHYAAREGNLAVLRYILASDVRGTQLLSVPNRVGETIGHAAAESGQLDVLRWIHENPELGTDFMRIVAVDGRTLAHVAAATGQRGALEWIRDCGG